ncbi:MAG: M14 family zinc carboxypeptidase [Pseudomonadota bacterium]|nr:M14 family zinc carboxypeptidase [Pseudomonadota bacterium]
MKKYNFVLKFIIVFVLAIFMGAMVSPAKRFRANLQLTDYKNQILFLQQHGVDVAGVNYSQKSVQVLVNEKQIEFLKAQGFNPEIIIRVENVDEDYKSPDEIEALLKDYSSRYPGITKLVSIGKSLEGRDIWALKISDNPDVHEVGEPAILFNGMHHAREVMTPEVPLDLIEVLINNYLSDDVLTRWVNSYEIWVVPMLNVDGNNKVWTEDNWWRKNTRGGYGVDINRNYPYGWASCNGSSSNKNTDTYRGESPGSEPETQALMGLVAQIRPVFDISFHSYGELVLYPYGCDGQRVETASVVEPIGQELASRIKSDSGGGTYTAGVPWEILYGVDGDDISWMYHEYQVIPFVIELNQDFQPEYGKYRDATVKKLRSAWTLLFKRLEEAGFYGQVIDNNLPVKNATLKISGEKYTQSYRVNPDGTFFIILNPGVYKLIVETPEKTTDAVMIEIGNLPLQKTIVL